MDRTTSANRTVTPACTSACSAEAETGVPHPVAEPGTFPQGQTARWTRPPVPPFRFLRRLIPGPDYPIPNHRGAVRLCEPHYRRVSDSVMVAGANVHWSVEIRRASALASSHPRRAPATSPGNTIPKIVMGEADEEDCPRRDRRWLPAQHGQHEEPGQDATDLDGRGWFFLRPAPVRPTGRPPTSNAVCAVRPSVFAHGCSSVVPVKHPIRQGLILAYDRRVVLGGSGHRIASVAPQAPSTRSAAWSTIGSG